jgi:hypothetical protein
MSALRDLKMDVRKEAKTLGEVDVPADKLWGAQIQRSLEHFSIGQGLFPREMIASYATLKKAAANAKCRRKAWRRAPQPNLSGNSTNQLYALRGSREHFLGDGMGGCMSHSIRPHALETQCCGRSSRNWHLLNRRVPSGDYLHFVLNLTSPLMST